MLKFKFSILLLLLLLLGCSGSINFVPNPGIWIKEEKVDINVGLYFEEFPPLDFYKHGFYTIQTGAALRLAADNTFKRLFTNVEILNSSSDFKNKDLVLLIIPRITRFNISKLSYTAELIISCKFVDQSGKIIYENSVFAKGESGGTSLSLLGGLRHKSIISNNSKDAFNKAFINLENDIKNKVDFNVYIKQ